MRSFFFIFLMFGSICLKSALALTPEAHLSDEKQEQRAINLFKEIRCISCGGQVIESSNSTFSAQMRELVRQEIADGVSDEQIKLQLREKFGDDILVSPPLTNHNIWLWLLPIILAVIIPLHAVKGWTRSGRGSSLS